MAHITCISLQTMQPVEAPQSCVLCLGNFDGVHAAHRALMYRAKKLRSDRFPDAACGVFCFDPPSSDYLTFNPEHLSDLQQKLELFRMLGMEYAFLADFESLRHHTPEQFVQDILIDICHCAAAICGFNYRFGYKGAGTPELLSTLLDTVEVQEEYRINNIIVSSTRIRELLREGRPEEAAMLLRRPYSIRARVRHGKRLGRTWGFPTLNQGFEQKMLVPKHGVYITEVLLPNGEYVRGISNVGCHPTVDQNAEVNCETHLLDYEGSLYGCEVTVFFLRFLRPEKKFNSAEELQAQIAEDIRAANEY